MKVLITGGAGYVGGYLTDYLLEQGYDVTVFDNLLYESRYLKKVPFVFGDILDCDKLSKLVPQFDAVIWLAAIVGDGACALNPPRTVDINQKTVKWLCKNYDGRIIFMSTCSVYGINDVLLNEDSPTNPLSVYAATKLKAEKHIRTRSNDHTIFRLGTLFGLGDTHTRIRLDLVVNILTQRAAMGCPLRVFGGEQWRPLLHVKDVATACHTALRKGNACGTFNLHDENYQIKDLASAISNLVKGTTIEYQELKFEDLRNYRVSSDSFREYGWIPQHTLDEGIIEMRDLIKEHRIKDVYDSAYSNVLALTDIHGWL